MTYQENTTIVAIATPPGKGGVAIVRVSGPHCKSIARTILQQDLKPRYAHYLSFYDQNMKILDQGIAIYFNAPNSFTGEDILELQGHGGPIIMDMLLDAVLDCGAILAKPGEFSERAFHNNKLDLAQAEAIADLIDCGSRQAANSALRSLTGVFSDKIYTLVKKVTYLRMYIEAAIDFPEEEIDFLKDDKIGDQIEDISKFFTYLLRIAEQGCLLRDGMKVVIAGKPNAGKSSLLNALAGKDMAIVTEIEGTTRDVLTEQINIDGLPLHIVDTAGLRDTDNPVERIGVERATKEIESADRILLVVDASEDETLGKQDVLARFIDPKLDLPPVTLIKNKIDLMDHKPALKDGNPVTIFLSARGGGGINLLRQHLKSVVGFDASESGVFMARRRHLDALKQAEKHVREGVYQLTECSAGELLAEELRLAQESLNTITGEFSSDDLLGEIFSSFCIGK